MRSRLFLKKTLRLMRIAADSDPQPYFLITQDGQPLLTQDGQRILTNQTEPGS